MNIQLLDTISTSQRELLSLELSKESAFRLSVHWSTNELTIWQNSNSFKKVWETHFDLDNCPSEKGRIILHAKHLYQIDPNLNVSFTPIKEQREDINWQPLEGLHSETYRILSIKDSKLVLFSCGKIPFLRFILVIGNKFQIMYQVKLEGNSQPNKIYLSKDKRKFIIARDDNSIEAYKFNKDNASLVRRYSQINNHSFNIESQQLVLQQKNELSIYYLNDGQKKDSITIDKKIGAILMIAPYQIIVGYLNGTIALWDFRAKKEMYSFQAHADAILHFSHYEGVSNHILVSATKYEIRTWKIPKNKLKMKAYKTAVAARIDSLANMEQQLDEQIISVQHKIKVLDKKRQNLELQVNSVKNYMEDIAQNVSYAHEAILIKRELENINTATIPDIAKSRIRFTLNAQLLVLQEKIEDEQAAGK